MYEMRCRICKNTGCDGNMTQEINESNYIPMNMEEFMKIVKKAKPSLSQTGFNFGLKVKGSSDKLYKIISTEENCKCCGNKLTKKELIIKFKTPIEHFTIFQAELMYLLFLEGKVPRDYCKYDQCIAGKRFIENIEVVGISSK